MAPQAVSRQMSTELISSGPSGEPVNGIHCIVMLAQQLIGHFLMVIHHSSSNAASLPSDFWSRRAPDLAQGFLDEYCSNLTND